MEQLAGLLRARSAEALGTRLCTDLIVILCHNSIKLVSLSFDHKIHWLSAALPSPGFYPEISGFFKQLGYFWDFYFKTSISGFIWDFWEREVRNLKIDFLVLKLTIINSFAKNPGFVRSYLNPIELHINVILMILIIDVMHCEHRNCELKSVIYG
jgi:hypothetical protein